MMGKRLIFKACYVVLENNCPARLSGTKISDVVLVVTFILPVPHAAAALMYTEESASLHLGVHTSSKEETLANLSGY